MDKGFTILLGKEHSCGLNYGILKLAARLLSLLRPEGILCYFTNFTNCRLVSDAYDRLVRDAPALTKRARGALSPPSRPYMERQ